MLIFFKTKPCSTSVIPLNKAQKFELFLEPIGKQNYLKNHTYYF